MLFYTSDFMIDMLMAHFESGSSERFLRVEIFWVIM
jgi:hypothetical protein